MQEEEQANGIITMDGYRLFNVRLHFSSHYLVILAELFHGVLGPRILQMCCQKGDSSKMCDSRDGCGSVASDRSRDVPKPGLTMWPGVGEMKLLLRQGEGTGVTGISSGLTGG